jgi:hypothetical protein
MRPPPRLVIPFPEISPGGCDIIADTLEDAIKIFETWELPVRVTTRLREACAELRLISVRGTFGQDDLELHRAVKALTLATDFYQIAQSLGDRPIEALVSELATAFRGTLDERTKDRSAYQMQSQLWFGLLLARAGLRPAIPPATGVRPDFVIRRGTLHVGVEVKRPAKVRSAWPAVEDAARQLRNYGQPGIIVIDLSDALGFDNLTVAAINAPDPPESLVEPHFLDNARDLTDRVRHQFVTKPKGKFSRVIGLVVFARLFAWHRSDMSRPSGCVFFRIPFFPEACAGLIPDISDSIREALLRGMESLGGQPPRRLGT